MPIIIFHFLKINYKALNFSLQHLYTMKIFFLETLIIIQIESSIKYLKFQYFIQDLKFYLLSFEHFLIKNFLNLNNFFEAVRINQYFY